MKNPSEKSNKLKKRLNAVGYARVARRTRSRKEGSIADQQQKIRQYCRKHGLKLAKIYSELESGATLNRPELTAMLERCSKGNIDYLIIYDSSRLSRETKDCLTIRAVLNKYNVKIVALTGMSSFEDDPYSKFFDEIITLANSLHPSVSSYGVKKIKRCPTCHQEL